MRGLDEVEEGDEGVKQTFAAVLVLALWACRDRTPRRVPASGPAEDVLCGEIALGRPTPHQGRRVRLEAYIISADDDHEHGGVAARITCGAHDGRVGADVGMVHLTQAGGTAAMLERGQRIALEGTLVGRVGDGILIDFATRLPDNAAVLPQDYDEEQHDPEGPVAGGSAALPAIRAARQAGATR